MSILIKNAMIVSMDENAGVIEHGYIIIKDDKIVNVSEGDYEGSMDDLQVIEGKGYCVLPGLINCHTHAAMTLLRGYGEGLPLMKWLNEKIWPAEAKFCERHIELGTQLACIEMLRTGTVAFNDMYFYQEKVMETVKEFKMKAILGIPIIGDDWEIQLNKAQVLLDSTRKYGGGLVGSMFAPHSTYTLSKEAITETAKVAKEKNCGIHIHISETKDEVNIVKDKYKCTPFEMLEETGLFENKTVGAHCVYISDSDIEIMQKYGISAVYNPESNMKLASGVSPVAKMLKNNINVCFGTDGASSNNNLNMFEEVQTGALLQKLWNEDATIINGKTALTMAIVNGARALGLKDSGAIKAGSTADIILVNIERPNMIPIHDIYSNLVFSANGSEVEYVIINGEVIMNKGEFVHIDEEKVLYECNKLCESFFV